MKNKIHYAVSEETAAEVIYHRAEAEKDFMSLMTFSGDQPTLREARLAKNYLDEKELRAMGQLVQDILILQRDRRNEKIKNREAAAC